jgi:tetratricopeptide (TPR) repeat protein
VLARLTAAALGLAALALAALAGAGLLSSLYASIAGDIARHSNGRSDSVAAGRLAVQLAPWRSAPHRYLAQSHSARGELDAALTESEAAVRASPADGYAWAYLARLVTAQLRFDERAQSLYAMALRRSPHAAPLHRSIAVDGVLRWRFGDVGLRELWRRSMLYSLHHERRAFLSDVVRLGRDPHWCAAQAQALPVGRWCQQAQRMRRLCSRAGLTDEAAAWCRDYGLLARRP